MKHYSAVCFDFDYTLGDSTDSIVAGFQYGFERLGHPIPDRETVRGTIGYLLEDAYTMLTGDRDPERQARFRAYFLEVAKPRQREETFLFPGAAELLRGLRVRGVRLGIVSTKTGETIEYIMDRLGLGDCLDFVIGSSDVKHHKPHPEGLEMALDRLGLAPERVLYCGDTVLDMRATQRQGWSSPRYSTGLPRRRPSTSGPMSFWPGIWMRWPGSWKADGPRYETHSEKSRLDAASGRL